MRTTITMATIAVLMTFQVHAASVTHTFQSGDPALASEINQNFQDLVNAINSGGGSASFDGSWFLSPSSDGALTARNVIVLKGDRGGDTAGGCNQDVYRVRVHFENTANQSVSTGGGSTVPNEIFIFGFVCADRGTSTVTYQQEYVYALPDSSTIGYFEAFAQSNGIEINQDSDPVDGTFELNDSYNVIFNLKRSSIGNSEFVHQVEMYKNGNETLVATNQSYVMSMLDSALQIGAPLSESFSNVAVRTFTDYSNGKARLRFHEQNIGVVQEVNNASFDDPVFNSQVRYDAIYYRVEGVGEQGSLAGTPFDGGLSAGRWFQ